MWTRLSSILATCLVGMLAACSSPSGESGTAAVAAPINPFVLGVTADEQFTWHAITSSTPVAPEVEVTNDAQGEVVTLKVAGFYTSRVMQNGREYMRVLLPEHTVLTSPGLPELPKVAANVSVAYDSAVRLDVVEQEAFALQTPPPLPSRGDITRSVDPTTIPYEEDKFYTTGGVYPESPVFAGETFVMRDLRGLPIHFQPFTYDSAAGTLQVYSRLSVRVVADGPERLRDIPAAVNPDFDSLYRGTFANYGRARYTAVHEPGRLLIIAADAYADAMLPLKEWKTARGLTTKLVKVSAAGGNAAALKTFITNEYRSPEGLTYVMLVGDSDTVPTLKGTFEKADSDPSLGMIDGNDYYPEVLVSRLSARSVAAVENQVAKFIAYEKTPDAAGTWYNKAIGIASAEGSPTDFARCEELRTALTTYGYTSVAKVYDPSAKKADLIAKINEGASLINYIGHGSGTSWGTTGFSVSDPKNLTNGSKLPFVIDVSCQNGSFVQNTSCLAETMLQAGTAAAPGGAIAMYSASTNASWVPPTVMQAWIVKELIGKQQRFTAGGLYIGGAMKTLDEYNAQGKEGQKLVEQYNIFGDASMVLRTKAPVALGVEHAAELPAAGPFAVTVKAGNAALAGAQVTLSAGGAILATVTTDASGIATLTYDAVSVASAKLVVFGANVVPYITDLAVSTATTANHAPATRAGDDQTAVEGTTVTLDGSQSADIDSDVLSFAWTQTSGPNVTLSAANVAQPTFVAPQVTGATALTFQLIVNDGKVDGTPDVVTVTVQDATVAPIPQTVNMAAAGLPIAIPDNNKTGIASEIVVPDAGAIATMEVDVDITHTYIGDLTVTLVCPSGTSAVLHGRTGGSADNIKQTYTPTACAGEPVTGSFKLLVSDSAAVDKGTLDGFALRIVLAVAP